MEKKLFVVRFSEEAEFITGAIEEFIASNVFGMNTFAADYESPYDVDPEEVFDNEDMAREYFATIQNILIDMGYEFSMSNRNTIIVEEPVKEQYIALETIEVTSQKVPAWATMYEDFVSRKD